MQPNDVDVRYIFISNYVGLKYSGCRDMGIRKFEFKTKAQCFRLENWSETAKTRPDPVKPFYSFF